MEPDPSPPKQAVAMGFIFMAGVAMLLPNSLNGMVSTIL